MPMVYQHTYPAVLPSSTAGATIFLVVLRPSSTSSVCAAAPSVELFCVRLLNKEKVDVVESRVPQCVSEILLSQCSVKKLTNGSGSLC